VIELIDIDPIGDGDWLEEVYDFEDFKLPCLSQTEATKIQHLGTYFKVEILPNEYVICAQDASPMGVFITKSNAKKLELNITDK